MNGKRSLTRYWQLWPVHEAVQTQLPPLQAPFKLQLSSAVHRPFGSTGCHGAGGGGGAGAGGSGCAPPFQKMVHLALGCAVAVRLPLPANASVTANCGSIAKPLQVALASHHRLASWTLAAAPAPPSFSSAKLGPHCGAGWWGGGPSQPQ